MGRSERYIPPSEEDLRRLEELSRLKKEFNRERMALFEAEFGRLKKSKLTEVLLQLAKASKRNEWIIEEALDVNKSVPLLCHDVEEAIRIATKVDKRRENENFNYDSFAYEAIKRGFSKLVEMAEIEKAKELSLLLIEKGSYQISCSDEGLMLGEIQDCLRVVILAAKGTPDSESWALEMLCCDSTGGICREELTAMAGKSGG